VSAADLGMSESEQAKVGFMAFHETAGGAQKFTEELKAK
jgi:hypothetical protein